MSEASSNFDFEKAAEIRDTIAKIKTILQTETVINFMVDNRLFLAVEYLDNDRIKLFLIRRNQILYRQIYEANHFDMQAVKRQICTYLSRKNLFIGTLDKAEIDEAYIIYNYLNSGNCQYVVIEGEWQGNTECGNWENSIRKILPFY